MCVCVCVCVCFCVFVCVNVCVCVCVLHLFSASLGSCPLIRPPTKSQDEIPRALITQLYRDDLLDTLLEESSVVVMRRLVVGRLKQSGWLLQVVHDRWNDTHLCSCKLSFLAVPNWRSVWMFSDAHQTFSTSPMCATAGDHPLVNKLDRSWSVLSEPLLQRGGIAPSLDFEPFFFSLQLVSGGFLALSTTSPFVAVAVIFHASRQVKYYRFGSF